MVAGCSDLVQTLIQHDLIREYWLMIFPMFWDREASL